MAEEVKTNGSAAPEGTQFAIQRLYIKDISFESPNSPDIFQKEWKPEVKLDLDTKSRKLTDESYEVVLSLTVTTSVGDDVAFLCEVQQAGIFGIGEVNEAQMAHMLGSYCPNILFPYAREAVTSMVTRGTFPQLNLAPVNFDALFASYVQKRQQEAQAAAAEASQGDA